MLPRIAMPYVRPSSPARVPYATPTPLELKAKLNVSSSARAWTTSAEQRTNATAHRTTGGSFPEGQRDIGGAEHTQGGGARQGRSVGYHDTIPGGRTGQYRGPAP